MVVSNDDKYVITIERLLWCSFCAAGVLKNKTFQSSLGNIQNLKKNVKLDNGS